MNIRSATKEDLPEILSMNTAALPHVSEVNISDMRRFLQQADPFLVIEKEGELAGFMIVLQPGLDYQSPNYTFFCNTYSDFDYVDRIVIVEKFQGKALGTALYNYLINHSEKERVTCEINLKPPNPNSMAFHKALGFKKVDELESENGAKSVAMMSKSLVKS